MDNAIKSLDPIDEVAELMRSLTYGEMIELASELRKQAGETEQIDRLANLIRSLTYGEMIELASELQKAARETEITAETLPTILHRWATGCQLFDIARPSKTTAASVAVCPGEHRRG